MCEIKEYDEPNKVEKCEETTTMDIEISKLGSFSNNFAFTYSLCANANFDPRLPITIFKSITPYFHCELNLLAL